MSCGFAELGMLAAEFRSDSIAMTDIFWFFALFFSCLVVFAVLHVIGLRRHRPVRLMLYLMGNYAFSASLASGLFFWAFGNQFSSPGCYAVANTGAVIAGFFASAFYIFLGPATADRSLRWRMMITPGAGPRDPPWRPRLSRC